MKNSKNESGYFNWTFFRLSHKSQLSGFNSLTTQFLSQFMSKRKFEVRFQFEREGDTLHTYPQVQSWAHCQVSSIQAQSTQTFLVEPLEQPRYQLSAWNQIDDSIIVVIFRRHDKKFVIPCFCTTDQHVPLIFIEMFACLVLILLLKNSLCKFVAKLCSEVFSLYTTLSST